MKYVLVQPTMHYPNLAGLTKYKQPNMTMLLGQANHYKQPNMAMLGSLGLSLSTKGLAPITG